MSKSEWIEDFKRFNGRDPKPREFRKALNKGEFTLDDDREADLQQTPVTTDPTRKELRQLKKERKLSSPRNGINSLVLTFFSLLFTLSPVLLILNPDILLNFQTKANIENLASVLVVMFFFGILLLLMAIVFALMSLFKAPRSLAIVAILFSMINLLYVYTVINFSQSAIGYFSNVIDILESIFK
ncbi:hypothetical protein DSM07_07130 [Oenococcus sp. UCMA 16435]|nr:hypothetical protein DSM07_07130 [Oenococcus sp. UCMA 16435]MDI4584574.1 hypothetical protein [Oenococcus sp. UCMA 14587]